MRSRVAGDLLLGADVMEREGGWNLLCKFFDNMGPIPHHMHQSDEFRQAGRTQGQAGSLLLSSAIQSAVNNFPHTYMGLEPGTTKEDIRRCLERWNQGDNGILFHSRAYRLEPGRDGRSTPASCTRRARW